MDYTPKIRRSSKTKAIDLFDGGVRDDYNAYFYNTFGQALRQSVCACETSNDANLSQALHLINGDTIQKAMRLNDGLIANFVNSGDQQPPEEILEKLFIRTLCRTPTKAELKVLLSELPEKTDYRSLKNYYDGVLWGLLNSSEFLFNH